MLTAPLPPPRHLWATFSLLAGQPAEAQELRRFWRAAVHLGWAPQLRRVSLKAAFLCGCSLGPFGTHSDFRCPINSIADLRPWRVSNLRFGGREQPAEMDTIHEPGHSPSNSCVARSRGHGALRTSSCLGTSRWPCCPIDRAGGMLHQQMSDRTGDHESAEVAGDCRIRLRMGARGARAGP